MHTILKLILVLPLTCLALEPFKLSEAQLASYQQEGFLIIKYFMNPSQVETVSKRAQSLLWAAEDSIAHHQEGEVMHNGSQLVIEEILPDSTPLETKVKVHCVSWAGAAEPDIFQASHAPKMLNVVSQLLASEKVVHLINQLNYKLPQDGIKFEWHQEITDRRLFDPNWQDVNGQGGFVKIFSVIQDSKVENGTIFYIPKSHLQGDLHLEKQPNSNISQIVDETKAVPLILEPGDVVFVHPYLVHGSKPNMSDTSRLLLVDIFAHPGATNKPYPGLGSAKTLSCGNLQGLKT